MNTDERVLMVLARANPMPDTGSLELESDAVTYLAALQSRSSEMTQLDTRPESTRDRRSGRLLLAAAVAAVLLGVAIVIFAQANETPPVATSPSVPPTVTPTTVTPTTTPDASEELNPQLQEALDVATAFTQGRADLDIEAMSENSVEGHVNGFIVGSLELMPEELDWQDAVGWSIQIEGCEVTNPEVTNTRVECQVLHSNAISESLGEGPFEGNYIMRVMYAGDEKLGVAITETTVAEALSFTFPVQEFTTGTWQPFVAWLEENHPDDLDAMLAGELSPDSLALFVSHGERTPRINPEATELWRQHVAEFVAEQG